MDFQRATSKTRKCEDITTERGATKVQIKQDEDHKNKKAKGMDQVSPHGTLEKSKKCKEAS